MPEKKRVSDIVKQDEVGDVRPETPIERISRLFLDNIVEIAAFAVVNFGMIVGTILIFQVDALRSAAFQLISNCVVGALAFLFGSSRRKRG